MCSCHHVRRAGLVALLAVAAACSEPRSNGGKTPRNAVLITLDTTRADAVDIYSGVIGVTPNLTGLARDALTYRYAHTVAPITLPAHASMLTGLYPPRHTLRDNGLEALPQQALTLAESVRADGLETAAFVAAAVLDEALGLGQGFDVYDQPARPLIGQTLTSERPAREVVAAATAWLASRDPGRRFFLWVHLFDPHAPYCPPTTPGAAAGDLRELYLGEVSEADRATGELFQALRDAGVWSDTFVVVTADHGEGLSDHGEPTHSTLCYESTLRVPLIVRYPDGYRAGEMSDDVVSVVDVYPTVLEALGVGAAPGLDGRSLYRRSPAPDRGVYFESMVGAIQYGWSPLSGWLDVRGKYIHSSEPEFFEVRREPAELDNRLAKLGGEVERYRQALRAVADGPALTRDTASPLSDELRARIESLGYTLGEGQTLEGLDPFATEGRTPPARGGDEVQRVQRGQVLLEQGRNEDAMALLEEVLAENSANVPAYRYRSQALMALGRYAEAAEAIGQVLERGAARPESYLNLATCAYYEQDYESAIGWLERCLALDPRNEQALFNIVVMLEETGRAEQAVGYQQRLDEVQRR